MNTSIKDIYDNVYVTNVDYDEKYNYKIDFLIRELFYLQKNTTIIDIGCGKGHYIKSLNNNKFNNVTGLELSSECCEKYLADVPHINANFIDYAATITDKKYNLAICMDMLEHINYKDIDNVIKNFERIATFSLVGIANHSDIFNGVELHLIQEDSTWWQSLLEKYFTHAELIYFTKGHRFFIFRCKNEEK